MNITIGILTLPIEIIPISKTLLILNKEINPNINKQH